MGRKRAVIGIVEKADISRPGLVSYCREDGKGDGYVLVLVAKNLSRTSITIFLSSSLSVHNLKARVA